MKKRLSLFAVIGVSSLALTGCAQWTQDWIQENCNTNAAYAQGVNDGMAPDMPMNTNFASPCPSNQTAINASYAKGFTAGLKGRNAQVKQEKNDEQTLGY